MKKYLKIILLILIIIISSIVFVSCNSNNHTHKWSSWYDNGDSNHMRMCLSDSAHIEYENHVFSDYEIIVPPTDILSGKKTRECIYCGYMEDSIIPYTGDHVFDQEIVNDKFLYKKTSEYSSIYYKSCECGAYGNEDYLFEDSALPDGYSNLEFIETNFNNSINTGIKYSKNYEVKYNTSRINQKLPSEYTQVEYIETDGEAYIDTGYNETDATTIDCDFYIYDKVNNYIFGGTQKSGCVYNGFWSNYIFEYNFTEIEIASTERLYMTQSLLNDILTCNINGTIRRMHKGTSLQTRMYLFACNGGQRKYGGRVRCYMFRISDNGKLMRDFVPCVRNVDEVAGMYDIVAGKFYSNAGDGNFKAGNTIMNHDGDFKWEDLSIDENLLNSYELVEYIEAYGAQQINTGIFLNPDTDSFEITFKSNEKNQNGMILASREDDKYFWFYHYADANKIAAYTISDKNQQCIDAGYVDTDIHTAQFYDRTLYIDNKKAGTLTSETGLSTNPIYLFSWGDNYFYNGRIYRCRLYKDNQVVRDFVPTIRKSDNELGMYDLINGVFYQNQGTGKFGTTIALPTLEEDFYESYYAVDYIETFGKQWIDTGVVGQAKWIYDIQYMNIEERQLMGHGGNGGEYWGLTNGFYGRGEWSTSNIYAGNRDIVQVNNFVGNQIAGTGGNVYINGACAYVIAYDSRSEESSAQMFGIDARYLNHCKLWRCIVYDVNNNLIRDFIPCLRKIDGVVGLYDTINKKFYGSQGNNNFGYGGIQIQTDYIIIGYDYGVETVKCSPMKIFDVEIRKDESLIKMIPALRNSDSKVGMFDIVNEVFYPIKDGCEIISSNVISHLIEEEKIIKEATYCEDGITVKVCKICGAEIYGNIPRTAYKIDIDVDEGIEEIRVLKSMNLNDYSISNTIFTRNSSSYNYSKNNAIAMVSFKLKDEYVIDEISFMFGNAVIQEIEENTFLICSIYEDLELFVSSKEERIKQSD